MSAKYILRFDDICSTMNWEIWNKIEDILIKNDIKPVLAVVPNNIDPSLNVDNECIDFWDRVQYWENLGWTIGIHGYKHELIDQGYGLIPISKKSEFVGLSYEKQLEKLKSSLEIFKKNSIKTYLWIAPAHSFDKNTIKALKELNVLDISDGLHLFPFKDRFNFFWIPQQLWKFRKMFFGVWTICYHHNHWSQYDINKFESDISKFKSMITGVDEIKKQYNHREESILDIVSSKLFTSLLWIKSKLKRKSKRLSN